MIRRPLLIALLAYASAAQAAVAWENLWHTPDQRGESLLRQGKPAEAARIFRDPRLKAYAELQAGNYQQATKDFADFNDSDSEYNRGNALARAGRLQEAIRAYDAALARDPNNRDARHNRNLVAQALEKQPPKPHPSSGDGKPNESGRSGNEQQAGSDKQGKNQANAGTDKQGGKDSSGNNQSANGQGSGEQNGSGSKPGTNVGSHRQGKRQPDQAAKGNSQPAGEGPQGQKTQAAQAAQKASGQIPDSRAQARADAADALSELEQPPLAAAEPPQLTERQLAEQEWLRRIPDDPGGLLRRKFMIEHMLRQQGKQP